jgi:hypothetical protein
MRVIPVKDDGSLLPSAERTEVERLFALNFHTGRYGVANRFGKVEPFPVEWRVFTNGNIVAYPPFPKGGGRKNSDLEC